MTKQRLSSLDYPSTIPANLFNLDLSLAIDKFQPGVHSSEELKPVISVVKRAQHRKRNTGKTKNPRCVSMPILPRTLKSIQEIKEQESSHTENKQFAQYKVKDLPKLPSFPKLASLPPPPILPPKRKYSRRMHKPSSRSVSMFPSSYNVSSTYMAVPVGPVNYTSPTQDNSNGVADDILDDDCESETEIKSNFNSKFKPVSKSNSVKTYRSATISTTKTSGSSYYSTTDSYDSEFDSDSGSSLSLTSTKSASQMNVSPPIPSSSQVKQISDSLARPKYIIVDDDDEEESMLSDITISAGNARINGSKAYLAPESEISSSSCSSDSGSSSSSFYSDSDDDLSTDLSTDLGSTTDDMTESDLDTSDSEFSQSDSASVHSDITVTRRLSHVSESSERSGNSEKSKSGSISSETPTIKNEKLLKFVESYLVDVNEELQIRKASHEVDTKVNEVIGSLNSRGPVYPDNDSHYKSSINAPSSYNDSLFSSKSSARVSYKDDHEPSPLTKELPQPPPPIEEVSRSVSLLEVAQRPQKFVTTKPVPPPVVLPPPPIKENHSTPQVTYSTPMRMQQFDELDWSPEIQPFTVSEKVSPDETKPLNIKKTRGSQGAPRDPMNRYSTQSYTSVSSGSTSSFKDATQSLKEHVRQRPFSFTLDSGKDYASSRYFTPETLKANSNKRWFSDNKRYSAPVMDSSLMQMGGSASTTNSSHIKGSTSSNNVANTSSGNFSIQERNSSENFKSLAPPRPIAKDKRWVSEYSFKLPAQSPQKTKPSKPSQPNNINSIKMGNRGPVNETKSSSTNIKGVPGLGYNPEQVPDSPRSRQNRFGDRDTFRHTSLPVYR
ncbi:hypothetical protein CLIB1423_02S01222 [[Candida] railenensis]|uniref:Uncharacterized protein n=1 Tax=[Candida] railenensis TaxID=45579 RepID=A0A9P0QL16_9ASCO|nr:hypothetical protein CLIB1423_02S01222 [[Candida] railenensis]